MGDVSVYLQQAFDLTGGLYVKVEQASGIAQVLNVSFLITSSRPKVIYEQWLSVLQTVFLLDADQRAKFVVPERVQVDYRAPCFCHQKLVEVGFVCSVCLSGMCRHLPSTVNKRCSLSICPRCTTCNSVFNYMLPQKQIRKGPLHNGKSTVDASASISSTKERPSKAEQERYGHG